MSIGEGAPSGGGRGRPGSKGRRRPRRATRAFGALKTLALAMGAAWDKDATERAAALTYYTVLALFPALLMTLSLVGLTGNPDASGVPGGLEALMPGESRPLVADTLRHLAEDASATTSLAALSGAAAAWAACSYAAVFRRALHHIHGVVDHRPAWRAAPRVVVTALLLLVLMACSTVCVVVSGELARRTGDVLHLGSSLVSAWRALRWPGLVAVAAATVLILFRSGPPAARGLRTTAPGGGVAIALWLLSSAGFAAYTTRLGTYDRLYGQLSGAVAFLVWLWFSNLALLVGAHYNAERASRPPTAPGRGAGGAGSEHAAGSASGRPPATGTPAGPPAAVSRRGRVRRSAWRTR
ncbi:YihY/virulence factor BrkB family protein [Streptomyces sp. NRRL F-5123]|uniref:YihY/virulence factor BrkB family protein n=1 Tax=Streptomyces sp. NRRL F-5123 TaxID=1463856 RepID=UPI0007C47524|nr:YihY/virulence factor BrkB family protein [Streptomyces sp. NRRL F-5123]